MPRWVRSLFGKISDDISFIGAGGAVVSFLNHDLGLLLIQQARVGLDRLVVIGRQQEWQLAGRLPAHVVGFPGALAVARELILAALNVEPLGFGFEQNLFVVVLL